MKKRLLICALTVTISASAFAQQSKPATLDYGTYEAHPAAPVTMAPTMGPRCPWMNLGTAGGLLGGDVTVSLTKDSRENITACSFTRSSARLEINVMDDATSATFQTMVQQLCPARSSPLKAVGNQASSCRTQDAAVVTGRVRDKVFVVKLTLPDAGMADAHARDAAEQVAGNLF
jgi:hypothetical protein